MASALDFIHGYGILHGDLRCQNIHVITNASDKISVVIYDFDHSSEQTVDEDTASDGSRSDPDHNN